MSKPLPALPIALAFNPPYAEDDAALAARLLPRARLSVERERRVDGRTTRLVEAIRAKGGGLGGVEEMLREYALSTKEGLALMVLAEALLRVPDAATADRLIEDKLGQGDFAGREPRSDAFLISASSWALGITARIIQPGETPEGILRQAAKRLGVPAVRTATRQAMRVMGNHFVLGQTIEDALKRAGSGKGRLYRYSFDMLGEGARTAEDARRYGRSYADAIEAIGRSAGNEPLPNRPGISVKLSALHPRFEATSRERVLTELVPVVIELARDAKAYDLNFTIDAEEADRLELSLEVIEAVLSDPSLAGWSGFGLAVQGYQKRAGAVIDAVAAMAERYDRRMMVRLVKGAYWDTEVKRAQERGLDDYPVFTRKAMTDLNYVACAEKLLGLRPRLYPQFATHNALTVASILERAGGTEGYEFQRLHGMGEAVYGRLIEDEPGLACRTYAPVGGHRDLLAYLVRRLLENGANSSFVSAAADTDIPVASLLRRPADLIGSPDRARHPRLPLPRDLYGTERPNSRGVELGNRISLAALAGEIGPHAGKSFSAAPLIDGRAVPGARRPVTSPIDGVIRIGEVTEADPETADRAMAAARAGFPGWSRTAPETRAMSSCARRTSSRNAAACSSTCCRRRPERPSTTRSRRCARPSISAATTRCRAGACSGPGRRCRDRRGRATCCGFAAGRSRGDLALELSPGDLPRPGRGGADGRQRRRRQARRADAARRREAVRLLHEAGVPATALHLCPGTAGSARASSSIPRWPASCSPARRRSRA